VDIASKLDILAPGVQHPFTTIQEDFFAGFFQIQNQVDLLKQGLLLVLKVLGLRGAKRPEPLALLHFGEFHVCELHFRVRRTSLLRLLLDRPRFSLPDTGHKNQAQSHYDRDDEKLREFALGNHLLSTLPEFRRRFLFAP
jgi:hypothetical protein